MRKYEIRAVNGGEVVNIATADTASEALIKVIDARAQYRRAWVKDETGRDVSLSELSARADDEHNER